MRSTLSIVLVVVVLISAVFAVIYQRDDRKQYFQVPPRIQQLGSGVGVIVPRSSLIGGFQLGSQTVRQRYGICSTATDLYLDDVSAGTCSGFLLSPNLFATAGTCVFDNNLSNLCANLAIIFNYATTSSGNTKTTFNSNEIFFCQSVVASSVPQTIVTVLNATTGLSRTDFIARPNYAVITLDRAVSLFGITTFSYFRSLKNLHVNEKTYTIGHPFGLSRKYDDGGRIWAIDGGATGRGIKIFTNSDSFSGSEGSPIFDADGFIIAMHASGNADTRSSRTSTCKSIVQCPNGITPDDDDCFEGELGTSICYFSKWNSAIEDCSTAVGSKRNLPPGVNENIHRFNKTNPIVKEQSDYYGVF